MLVSNDMQLQIRVRIVITLILHVEPRDVSSEMIK